MSLELKSVFSDKKLPYELSPFDFRLDELKKRRKILPAGRVMLLAAPFRILGEDSG